MKNITYFLFIMLLVCILIFSACSEGRARITNQNILQDKANIRRNAIIKCDKNKVAFIDALGDEVEVPKQPKRVICLYHSYLELWDLAGGRVIGRVDSKRPVPKWAENAQIVGSTGPPNTEKILSLKPDLVILSPTMNGQTDIIKVFKENNIPYIALKYETFNEYLDALNLFTTITGRQDLFDMNGREVENRVNKIINNVPKDKSPKVLLLFATARGVKASLPNSTVGSMLEDLGADNIAWDAKLSESQMQTFSMEKILERDPDFILVQTMGSDSGKIKDKIKKDVESNPAWGSLRAVKNGNCIFLDKELYLYKPNERYDKAYRGLAQILYPDIFN